DRPMVLTCHGTDVRLVDSRWLARRLAHGPFQRAKVVTAVSQSLADVIARRMHREVAPTAVQPMPVAELDRPWSTGGGGLVVLGRLTVQKRVDLALEALAALRRSGRNFTLRIAGDGAARGDLEARAGRLGLVDSVKFLGEVAPTQVPSLFLDADCALM